MSEGEQPAGPLLDALGVTVDLEPNQQITEALVLAKCVDFTDNTTGLLIGASIGLDWLSQMGLIAAAQHIVNRSCGEDDE